MSFAAIAGHGRAVKILKKALANKTLAHAYLFSGETGIGKKMAALALAAAVNCQNVGEEGGCDVCPTCRKIAAGGHPDIHILVPEGEEIKIDQVRQVQSDLALKPFEGTKKTLIVDGVDRMNAASSNAFLKTLEEPPGETLIILITSLPQSLLPTIRSRCQEIRFQPLSRQTLAQELTRKRGLSDADAWFVAALARGSLGRGLDMDAVQEKTERHQLIDLWSGLPQLGSGETLVLAETFAKDRDRFDRLLMIGIECLRDVMVYRETNDERMLVFAQAKEQYRKWGERITLTRMFMDLELFAQSQSLLERRVSAQLVAENLFFKLGRG